MFITTNYLNFVAICIVTVQNVEAKRLLPGETHRVMHPEALPPEVMKRNDGRNGLRCKKGCHLECFYDPNFPICRCLC